MASTDGTPHEHGYLHDKDDYLKRLRRIEGQARGLQRMVEEEKYCIDILTQVSAVTKALQSVALGLLDEHMAHCVVDAARRGRPRGRTPRSGRRPTRSPASSVPDRHRRTENPMSETRTFTVTGMTCAHCVASVTEEVQEIAGVEDVDVVLETGTPHRHRARRRRRRRPRGRRGSRLPARMNSTPVRIAGFVLGLAVVFAVALGVGRRSARSTSPSRLPMRRDGHGDDGGHGGHEGGATAASLPGGLAVSENGYTLRLDRSTAVAGRRVPPSRSPSTGRTARP